MALENADAYYLDQEGIIKYTDNLLLYKDKLLKEDQAQYKHLSGN